MIKAALRVGACAGALLVIGALVAEQTIRWLNLFQAERQAVTRGLVVDESDAGRPGSMRQLHPFLGWVQRPGTSRRLEAFDLSRLFPDGVSAEQLERFQRECHTNAMGFFSSIGDYRAVRPHAFTIGIFGGSVAVYEAVLGAQTLREVLAHRLGRSPEAIVVLNFAESAYKQPQQLMTFAWAMTLGVHVDAVVNIDGFNEVALGGEDIHRGLHPAFPYSNWTALLREASSGWPSDWTAAQALRVLQARRAAQTCLGLGSTSWFRHSELAKAVLGRLRRSAMRQALVSEGTLQQLAASRLAASEDASTALAEPCFSRPDGCWELIGELWTRASVLMSALAEQTGAVYLHVLQPNQYLEGTKSLSDEERAYAYDASRSYRQTVPKGYAALRHRSAQLLAAGVEFRDLTDVFADHSETLYLDTCCHYNMRGIRVVASAIAEALADVVEQRKTER